MKWLLTCLAICAGFQIADAQTWTWQHPSPQGNSINDVYFSSDAVGYICGDFGTILKTTNTGKTWTTLKSNTLAPLMSIRTAPDNPKFVVSCGGFNTFVVSTDAGATWRVDSVQVGGVSSVPALHVWRSVAFRQFSTTFAMCGDNEYIAGTTNAGVTWSYVKPPNLPTVLNNQLNRIVFSTTDGYTHGIAVGESSALFVTTDGGSLNSWIPVPNASKPTGTSTSASFRGVCVPTQVSSPDFYVVGTTNNTGIIWKTTDRGSTWVSLTNGPSNQYTYIEITPQSTKSLFLTTTDGSLVKSTDGGLSFTSVNNFPSVTTALSAVALTVGGTECVVSNSGRIFTAVPQAFTWIERSYGSINILHDIWFTNTKNGAACGDGSVYTLTTNGGQVWTDAILSGAGNLNGVCFSDANHGYMCDHLGQIFHTQDGGVNWKMQGQQSSAAITCIRTIDDATAIAGSAKGEIITTSNAGGSWQVKQLNYWGIQKICMLSPMVGWAMGVHDTIFATTDGGVTWGNGIRVNPLTTFTTLNDFAFSDIANGWVSTNGQVFRTADGGLTWTSGAVFSPAIVPSTQLMGISALDANHLWCVGITGLIYYSSNGGAKWTTQPSATNLELLAVHMVDNANGWTCGYSGSILKYDDIHGTLLLSPRIIDFGKVAYTYFKDSTITATNPSDEDITVNSSVLKELDASGLDSQFVLLRPVPFVISAHSSDTMTIRFQPKVANGKPAAREAVMTLNGNNNAETTPSISLLGNGANSYIVSALSNCDHDFGDVYLTHCQAFSVVIKNMGEIPVTISAEFWTLDTPSQKSKVFRQIGPNAVIQPGETGNIQYEYCPDHQQNDVAKITLLGAPNTMNCTVKGRGVWLYVDISPKCFELDSLDKPGQVDTKRTTFTIKDTGNVDDSLKAIIQFADPLHPDSQYQLLNTGGYRFNVNMILNRGPAQKSVWTLIPVSNEKSLCDSAWIIIENKWGDRLDSVCFHWCYNVCSVNDYNVTGFHCVPINTCDTPRNVTLNNTGNCVLHVDSIRIVGFGKSPNAYTYPAFYHGAPINFPYDIPMHDSVNVAVKFCPGPDNVGACACTLSAWYPDSDGIAYTQGACGLLQGLNYYGDALPACLDFGTVAQNQTPITYNDSIGFINLSPATSIHVNVSHSSKDSAVFVLTPAGDFDVPPATQTPPEHFPVKVTFKPSGPGVYSDTITYVSPLAGSTFHTCVTGTSYTAGLFWHPATVSKCVGPLLIETQACDSVGIIENTGTTPVDVLRMAIVGDTAQWLALTITDSVGSPVTLPVTVRPGDSIFVHFCYHPHVAGHHTITATFTSSISGVSPSFTRCGDAYSTGVTTVKLVTTLGSQSSPLQSTDLGAPSLRIALVLNSPVDNSPATSFRARVYYDPTRLVFVSKDQTNTLTASNWTVTPTPGSNFIDVVACGPALKGTGTLVYLIFTPYFGSSRSTELAFDSVAHPFKFNLDCTVGDTTNPIATYAPASVTVYYDSVCGINVFNIKMTAGTYLYQTMPNPATQFVTVPFQTKEATHVKLRVINTFGVEVMNLLDADVPKGYKESSFSTSALPEGMYFYELVTSDTRLVRRMLIVK